MFEDEIQEESSIHVITEKLDARFVRVFPNNDIDGLILRKNLLGVEPNGKILQFRYFLTLQPNLPYTRCCNFTFTNKSIKTIPQ